MLGRKRSRSQPHAAFLLPSFPGSARNLKPFMVETTTTAKSRDKPTLQESLEEALGSPSDAHSQRLSVTSVTSTASFSFSSSTAATVPSLSSSLSTSPTSLLSTTPQDVSSTMMRVPFPTFEGIDNNDEPSEPPYLTALSEPDTEKDARFKDPCTLTFKPNTGSLNPSRRLQRVLPTTLRCRRCSADLAFASQIVSKGFTGRNGRAYLISAPASHADHLFTPEVNPLRSDEDTMLWGNEEEDAIWEDMGVAEPNAIEDERVNDGTGIDDSLARGLARAGGIQDLPNIRIGRAEYRRLVTGMHVVADISCAVCCSKVGWKYIDVSGTAQRYKVGKFVLELAMLSSFHSWEDVDVEEDAVENMQALANSLGTACSLTARYRQSRLHAEGESYNSSDRYHDSGRIEFDSEDEDECEEIFNGTWDAAVVARRRALKRADELR
ncbi:hypothetical protein SEPCBS57363_005998 [Sporothrix epigloea]|uniref:Yippee domain-containing protein n=1 Tax=Sporothrix epigloea TaxID=1892477 RepID=A0ABP0E341_9PEZI